MKVDLFSLTQNGNRTISFMAQTLGLMADLDFDTEHLRWMGDSRFIYGFIKGGEETNSISFFRLLIVQASNSIQGLSCPAVLQTCRERQTKDGGSRSCKATSNRGFSY